MKLVQRDENKTNRQLTKNHVLKQLKFEKVKKQNGFLPQTNEQPNRRFVHDQQAMNQIILSLKEENNELQNIIKLQQTQLSYYQQQQKQMVLASCIEKGESEKKSNYKGIDLQILRLRKKVQTLQQENSKIRKGLKYTNIKQLQASNQTYEEHIKFLSAKIKGLENSTTKIQELNKIIQKEYLTSLKNKQLSNLICQKNEELESANKTIKKLKYTINKKNLDIQNLKVQKDKIEQNAAKGKNMQEWVPKSELLAKKKQLISMTEIIEKMEAKLNECQSKAQALQQENIDNLNRETSKRKQILNQFQKLKKSHDILQETLAMAMKKSSDISAPIRLQRMISLDSQFKKEKNPIIVKQEHIKETVQKIVFKFQQMSIPYQQAPSYIRLIRNQSIENQQMENLPMQKQKLNDEKISIRQIIQCLSNQPIAIEDYDQKQILARYLVEVQEDGVDYINYSLEINLSYTRSIFKKILQQYHLFSQQQISAFCSTVHEFIKRNEHSLRISLSNQQLYSAKFGRSQDSTIKRKRNSYKCEDIVEIISKQNQLSETVIQFIHFWVFNEKKKYLTIEQFEDMFKLEGVCTFITQEPLQNI